MPVERGTVIAKRYRVTHQLGKGGMGEVFAAENTRTGRRVALKVLRAESKQKQSAIERFRREARAAGAISSDFVTQVLDVDDDPEYGIVLVFELLEGESLVDRLKRTGPVPFDELWGIVEAVWMGLADAHAAGVIHRDLKPSNVFLENRRSGRRVKILDFGISKLPKKISTQSLTQVGQSLGTFSFMPPEQIGKAKTVDHRADIYACATLIYQALSGKLPYQAKNVVAMMELKNKTEPRTLREVMSSPVDARLEAFIARGLARNPDERFQSCLEALEGWRQLRPPGAASVMDLDTSGAFPQEIDDGPSSGEIKTRVLHKQKIAERVHGLERVPTTPRDGGYNAAMQRLPEAAVAPQMAQTVSEPHGGNGMNLALARTQPAVAEVVASQSSPALARLPAPGQATVSMNEPVALSARPSGHLVPSESQLVSVPPPRSSIKTALTLVLGALGLMLVGFATVALVLHLLNSGPR
jgi:serine/threonine protein kinase